MSRKTKRVRFNIPGSKTLASVGKKGVSGVSKGVSSVFGFFNKMLTKKRGHKQSRSTKSRRRH